MTRSIERRVIDSADIEIRRAGDGSVSLRGYAAVFNSTAHGEVVRPSAFNRTLAQRDNVRLLVNHDGVPLASTKAGTMTLKADARGLLVDVPALDMANPSVQELVSAMDRGDIDQMSFAFSVTGGGETFAEDGTRELREVILFDVSVVTYPWYEATSASIDRGLDRALVSLRNRSQLTPEERDVIILALDGSCVMTGDIADDEDGDAETSPDDPDADGDPTVDTDADGDGEPGTDGPCPYCQADGILPSDLFCWRCGAQLPQPATAEALGNGPAAVPSVGAYSAADLFEIAALLAA